MLTLACALAFLAAALSFWPGSLSAVRLDRAVAGVDERGPAGGPGGSRRLPGWARSRTSRGLLVCGGVAALTQFWPWAVVAVVVAVGGTAVRALVRGQRDRLAVREEQAAVEGLGVLVAELRAGRTPSEALAAAGRHCGDPRVGALLSRLGRSILLGVCLAGGMDADGRAPPPGRSRALGSGRGADARDRVDAATWQVRLTDGVRLSQRTGCGLADVVAAVESDLARRGRQRAELRATAAGNRATVALLAGLPILGLAMGSGIGAEPVRVLTATTIGHVLMLAGVGLELLGLAWSRRLTGRALREG